MKLIIIILALVLERGLHAGQFLNRFIWFKHYLNLLRKKLEKSGLWRGIIGVIFALLPILLITAIIYYSFCHVLWGLISGLIALLILFYCLGPADFYMLLSQYFIDQAKGDHEVAKTHLDTILPEHAAVTTEWNRAVTKSIFCEFNKNVFAVLLWFVILGPLGALLYRLTCLIVEDASRPDSPNAALKEGAKTLQDLLDWIPVRLLSLIFALVGNFMHSFGVWVKTLWTSTDYNQEILTASGLRALDLQATDPQLASIDENKAAIGLIDRALVVFIVVIALFVLGRWVA